MIDPALTAAIQRRGITRVCHFTQARNLPHILVGSTGILCKARLNTDAPDTLNRNDLLRLDRRETHINCSIEYPNHWMLGQVKQRERIFTDWVVLLIDPQVLALTTTYFSPQNAAGCEHAAGVAGLEALYLPEFGGGAGRRYQRPPSMVSACPTNGQAEAMIEGHIPVSMITGIAVYSEEQAAIEAGRLSLLDGVPPVRWIVAPGMFDGAWSPAARAGRRPPEFVCVPPTCV